MSRSFSETMSALRRDRGLSQRAAASALGISQALLSHYENGAREPGLAFVCRACDYYGVSADYLLGRTDARAERSAGTKLRALCAELRALADAAEADDRGEDE
jgi:Predicted transcriptional regulator